MRNQEHLIRDLCNNVVTDCCTRSSACLLCTVSMGDLQTDTTIHTVFVIRYLHCAIDKVYFYCCVYPVECF